MEKGDNKRSQKRKAIARAIATKRLPVSSALLANDEITDKQKAYVENRAFGMNKQDSAVAAGYSDAAKEATRLEQLPIITEALAAERAANARLAGYTREDVINGLKRAIDDAVILADPQGQIAGWREIAKICGYYAPEIKQHVLTAGQVAKRGELEVLSDEELLDLIGGTTVEGESIRVQ